MYTLFTQIFEAKTFKANKVCVNVMCLYKSNIQKSLKIHISMT